MHDANVAVTFLAPFIVKVHWIPFVESQPAQALKKDPIAGVAVNVTGSPATNVSEQYDPQLIPPGELLTVPIPVPSFATVSVLKGNPNGL